MLKLLLVAAAGEIIIHGLFLLVSRIIGKPSWNEINLTSILKGLFERTFLVVSLYFGLHSSLTLLGALKIATRIKDNDDRISNDFFLIGNLISVLFGITYFLILENQIGEAA